MILSSPFSRQNRSHQSWTNSASHHHNQHASRHHTNSLRKPAPKQPAPQEPSPKVALNGSSTMPMNGYRIATPTLAVGSHKQRIGTDEYHQERHQLAATPTFLRSHTLNRLDLVRARQRQQQQVAANTSSLRRNVSSSLANYPQPLVRSGRFNSTNQYAINQVSVAKQHQIYAPASIASPHELANYKRPVRTQLINPVGSVNQANNNEQSQHYAATSYRGTASESGRSGRESALGNLLHRLGTLRRKAKWSRSNWPRRSLASDRSDRETSDPPAPVASNLLGNPNIPPPLPDNISLDPEIYATGRKRVEAEDIYAEGSRAIDSNIQRRLLEHQLDEKIMSEGETKTFIDEQSKQQTDYKVLVNQLLNWINDELAEQRIIIRDLQDDLYDGQVLGKLVERLHQIEMDLVEVTQNEVSQRRKLRAVLDTINRILSLQARWARIRWSVEGIHGKNLVEIIFLLVTLAKYYRAPIKLPQNVRVRLIVVQKSQGKLVKRSHEIQLTDSMSIGDLSGTLNDGNTLESISSKGQRDAFDTLLEFAPDKLVVVKQSLVRFANRHLNKINISCFSNHVSDHLDPEQFSDGLLFVFLIASLEDYFVPLGNLFTTVQPQPTQSMKLPLIDDSTDYSAIQRDTNNNIVTASGQLQTALEPTSYTNTQPIEKLHNVNVALQLIEEAGINLRERVRAEDIVNGDLKSVLRVLYALFSRYKHI